MKSITKTRIKIVGVILLCAVFLVCRGLLKRKTGAKNANLFGYPERNNQTVDGLMNSKENTVCRFSEVAFLDYPRGANAEQSELLPERDLYYGKVLQNHVHISSDANLGVWVECGESKGSPEHLLMYVFKYSDDYEWKKEDAYISSIACEDSFLSFPGGLDEPDSSTLGSFYLFELCIPRDMPDGKYTVVIVKSDELFKSEEVKYPDGTVLAMVDFKVN